MKTARQFLLSSAALALLASPLRAQFSATDTIIRTNQQKTEGVTITADEYTQVKFTVKNASGTIASSVPAEKVARIVHWDEPPALDSARQKLERGEYQKALAKFGEAAKTKARPWLKVSIALGKGDCLRKMGNLNGALASYRSVLKLNAKARQVPSAVYGLGLCYAQLGGTNLAKAAAEFAKLESGQLGESWKPFGTFGKAVVLSAQGTAAAKSDKAKAAKLFEQAVNLYNGLVSSLQASAGKGNGRAAGGELLARVKAYKGKALLGQGKPTESLDWLNHVIANARQNRIGAAEAYNARGDVYWGLGQYEQALWDFMRVHVVYFSNPVQHRYALARCVDCLNQLEDAKKSQELVAQFASYFPYAKGKVKYRKKPRSASGGQAASKAASAGRKQAKILKNADAFVGNDKVGAVQQGQTYGVVEVRGDWVCLQLAAKQVGWVPKNICQLPDMGAGKGTLTVTRDGAKVYEAKKVVAQLKKGESFPVISSQGDWFAISVQAAGKKVTGWIHKNDVQFKP